MRWVRPMLLITLMLGLFVVTSWFAREKLITAEVYLATWSPIISIMVGHLFGERSALKKPGTDT